jgi:hypothetical protein
VTPACYAVDTSMKATVRRAHVLFLALVAAACSKDRDAARSSEAPALSAPQAPCGHAVCATDFFIDMATSDCALGSPCSLKVNLVATGDYHINDDYPYRFKADDAPGVEFLGTDPGGKNAFSKAAGDWRKAEAKSGAMTVNFTPADRGSKTIAGTFKLSVCSPQSCLLEQRQVKASVLTK